MRKRISLILAFILILFTFTGCLGELSETDKHFKEISSTNNLSGKTITLIASKNWITDEEMQLGSNFEAATGVEVIYNLYPDDEYTDKLFESLNSDNPPDIFLSQSGFAIRTSYHLDKYACELSNESWKSIYDFISVRQTSIDGINYGMTYYDTSIDYYLIYNKRLFEQAGITSIPTTYDEFTNACDRLARNNILPIYEPMADGWHQTMLFAETGMIFEKLEPGLIERLNCNESKFAQNPNMKKSLQQIQSLSNMGYLGSSYSSDTYEEAADSLASGEYAMCMLKPGAIKSIINSNLNHGYTADDFGIMLLPICDNQMLNIHPTGPSHFVCNRSSNQFASKLYLEYLTSRDSIQYMIDNSAEISNLPFNAGQTTDYNEKIDSFISNYDYSNSGLVLQDSVKYFNEQWAEISLDILKMCNNELTPDQVLQNIDHRRSEFATACDDSYWVK